MEHLFDLGQNNTRHPFSITRVPDYGRNVRRLREIRPALPLRILINIPPEREIAIEEPLKGSFLPPETYTTQPINHLPGGNKIYGNPQYLRELLNTWAGGSR